MNFTNYEWLDNIGKFIILNEYNKVVGGVVFNSVREAIRFIGDKDRIGINDLYVEFDGWDNDGLLCCSVRFKSDYENGYIYGNAEYRIREID